MLGQGERVKPAEPEATRNFTLLAGIFLTDQTAEWMGNLWVWPGSHRAAAAYYREHGPDFLLRSAPYPRVELSEPRQVVGRAGDLLLAHYLLGHNIGGNVSASRREVVYTRAGRVIGALARVCAGPFWRVNRWRATDAVKSSPA